MILSGVAGVLTFTTFADNRCDDFFGFAGDFVVVGFFLIELPFLLVLTSGVAMLSSASAAFAGSASSLTSVFMSSESLFAGGGGVEGFEDNGDSVFTTTTVCLFHGNMEGTVRHFKTIFPVT